MKIIVKRNIGFMGAVSKVSLKVKQQKVESLKHSEQVELDIQGE
ncbi:hypothetical protein [Listeria ivanovii]|nr:hypothetical protein [Listeria ivanovii]